MDKAVHSVRTGKVEIVAMSAEEEAAIQAHWAKVPPTRDQKIDAMLGAYGVTREELKAVLDATTTAVR